MEEKGRQSRARKVLHVVLILVISFLLNVIWSAVVGIVYGIVLLAKGVNITDPGLLMDTLSQNIYLLFFSSIYNLFAIGVVYLFWHFADKRRSAELGFGLTVKIKAQVLWGMLAAVAAILLITIFGAGFGVISFQGLGTDVFTGTQIAFSMLIGIITFLLVGFGEETVYRAYIQKHMVEMIGNKLGLIVSAFIFMAVHLLTYGKLLDLVDVFLAGIILGYAFILTKSIYLPAAFHFMWDFLQVNIFRLQDYDYYKGPVMFIYNNAGNLIINNFNLGNKLEVVFIAVELIILLLMYIFRGKIKKLAV